MEKGKFHETLATLYFRLNGYFTTGLIVHAVKQGEVRTDTDCLAVRHPHHSQAERDVETSEFLGILPDVVDLIVCEVKSSPRSGFNASIRTDPEILNTVLRWAGVFEPSKVDSVVERLHPLLEDPFSAKARAGIIEGNCRVRPLVCSPRNGQQTDSEDWRLTPEQILQFTKQCLNPLVKREMCATKYTYDLWGDQFTEIVKFIKRKKNATLADLYNEFGVQ